MWIHKYEKDDRRGLYSPIPTQIVSNEEFVPIEQTRQQKQIEQRIQERADRASRRLGMGRRQFLATSAGMATAFLAMNEVFGGDYFRVDESEAIDFAAADERWPKGQFIFDVQTHFVDITRPSVRGIVDFRRIGRAWNPELRKREPALEDISLANYIKEVFFDSDTVMAVISGVPAAREADSILPVEQMVGMRNDVNGATRSRRVMSHGLVAPNLGPENLDEMQRQREELKIDAWKMYTGAELGVGSWWMDDEKIAYPMLQKSVELGVKNVCVHKGLPLIGFNEEHCNPRDIEKAARDFPQLNFVVYHSGFRNFGDKVQADEDRVRRTQHVDWVSDLCKMRKANPGLTNVYMELGTTFAQTVITHPLLCGHVLGQILDAFGADHVLWGTDSIWWGSPQWQIEALRRFRMPAELVDRHGYPELTDEVRTKIFGLNAARVYGVDVQAKRNAIPDDYLTTLKTAYLDDAPARGGRYFGWVRDKG